MSFSYVMPYGGSSNNDKTYNKEKTEVVTYAENMVEAVPSALSKELSDKSDWVSYTLKNTPIIAMAGALAGAHEAFLHYERTPILGKQGWPLFRKLAPIVFNKTAYATLLGAVFCATDALYEKYNGKHDMTSGVVAGAVTGAVFSIGRPLPQPLAWPLVFAAAPFLSDLFGEKYDEAFENHKHAHGPIYGRENWSDPIPPRTPVRVSSINNRLPNDNGIHN